MIVRSLAELDARHRDLGAGDVYVGPLPAGGLRGVLALDLCLRGVRFLPSLLARELSRSKAAQVLILGAWMAPHTTVVTRRVELLGAIQRYAGLGVGPVVTKQEGMHCGHGVRRWDHVEAAYNALAFDERAYPFVLQPFLEGIVDLRVIVVGEYVEAYVRENRLGFRANLAAGGKSAPRELDAVQIDLCRSVMRRGAFPYAHIDLHLAPGGVCYLSEIALEGGVAGARITRADLARRKHEEIERLLAAGIDARTAAPV